MGAGADKKKAQESSPLALYGTGSGLYNEVARTDGKDNFGKPPVGIRSMDEHMAMIAKRVEAGCGISGNNKYMLAVGDRCCAPQWGKLENCVCEFPADAQ